MSIIYNYILYAPFFASLFWAITLLYHRKDNSRQQNIWIVFMVVMSVCSPVWEIFFDGIEDYTVYYKLDVIDVTLTLEIFPLIYFYFHSLTHPRPSGRQYMWFAPGIVVGVFSAILYAMMGGERSAGYIREEILNPDSSHFEVWSLEWLLYLVNAIIYSIILALQAVVVMIYSTANLIRYRKGLANFFSNLDQKSIENHRAVLIGLYVLLAMALVVVPLWSVSFERYYATRYILMAVTGATIYYMGYHVSLIRFEIEEAIPNPAVGQEDVISPLYHNELREKLLPQIIELIDKEKMFLQPNLSRNDIALSLGTNRTYVSHLINTEFQCNFYDFIKGKRIEFACEQIRLNPALSQEQVAGKCGFVSASTFSRAFKQQMGMTFSQYRKTLPEGRL